MSSRNRRNSRSMKRSMFGKKSYIKASRIKQKFGNLFKQKKDEIWQLTSDLKENRVFTKVGRIPNEKGHLFFRVNIPDVDYSIELRFFVWDEGRGKRKPDNKTSSRIAWTFVGINENIGQVETWIVKFLEGIKKGCATEYLYSIAHKRLKERGEIISFRKCGDREDIKGKDFVSIILKNGVKTEVSEQAKSSWEALMSHKEKYPEIPGSYRKFTGDTKVDIEIIEGKVKRIIEAYKENKIIFI